MKLVESHTRYAVSSGPCSSAIATGTSPSVPATKASMARRSSPRLPSVIAGGTRSRTFPAGSSGPITGNAQGRVCSKVRTSQPKAEA